MIVLNLLVNNQLNSSLRHIIVTLLFRTRTACYTKNKYSLPGISQPKNTIHIQCHFLGRKLKWRFFFNRSYLRPNSKLRDSTISHYFVWIGGIYLFLFFLIISLFLHLITFFSYKNNLSKQEALEHTLDVLKKTICICILRHKKIGSIIQRTLLG